MLATALIKMREDKLPVNSEGVKFFFISKLTSYSGAVYYVDSIYISFSLIS